MAVKSAGVTIFSGGFGLGIQMVSTVVLARLLAPRDFGLVAMVTTFSLLLVNVGLNGITEAVVQEEKIDHQVASNLFWTNVALGGFLTVAFAASGPLLAKFYNEPLLTPITAAISTTIFFTSISVMHLALLKKAMLFTSVAKNDIIARTVSVAVSIFLGAAGFEYWALVLGACALPLSTAIGAWILCPWKPGAMRRSEGTGSLLRFAANTYGRFIINYATRNTDNLLVGWRFGANILGFYKKAYDLFALSSAQLVSSTAVVAVSALSRVRHDREQFFRYLFGAMTVLAFIGMGLSGELVLIGKDLIRLLLGPRWAPAGNIFILFAPGIGAMLLYGTHGWIHLSIGEARRWIRWGMVELTVTLSLFLVGLRWGAAGVAAAWCLSFWILTIPAIKYAGEPIGLKIRPVIALAWRYIVAAALASWVAWLMLGHLPLLARLTGNSGAALRILAASAMFCALYSIIIVVLYGGYEPLQSLYRLACEFRPQMSAESTSAPLPDAVAAAAAAPAIQPDVEILNRPLVSILIPAYNAQNFVADTLRSALAQTWQPKEIILVDDGSKDHTLTIARKFESSGLRIVAHPNQGAAAARNLAYSLSRGDYIQWLDADDLLAPDKIALQMKAAPGTPKRVLLSAEWGTFMYALSRARFVPTALWADLSPVEWLLRKMGQNLFMQTATWLPSRELTEATGEWDTRLLHDDDGEYFCRMLLASDGVKFVPDSRVFYRCFGIGSLSHIAGAEHKIASLWLSMQLHLRYLQSLEQSERVRTACLTYLRTSLINFYPDYPEILAQIAEIEEELQGKVGVPELSWEYSWLRDIFGWDAVKPTQRFLRGIRWSSQRCLQKALYQLEKPRKAAPASGAGAMAARPLQTGLSGEAEIRQMAEADAELQDR